ncbi:ClC family H(+)/Cl(-) exchange transporter [Fructilactobacillus carniphilus]|uniref:Chloride channel protein n=1 Tax=Fructilactobacillus carniphilus TaxID=2940297 RepID=A0ABY5BV23_9LACO|nr:ClC family H(+)/Cl(-) exchange transporter [Fructilactobacillus carniphilus]USS90349.1 chloride channel protein [Fructilactobacillus carniphilus]
MAKPHWLALANLKFVGISAVIGIATGGVISVFRVLIEHGLQFSTHLYQTIPHHWQNLWIVIPLALLLAIVVGLLVKSEPSIRGSGIPQVEAQLAGNLEMNWIQVLWKKFVAGVLTNSTGVFMGREGPSIQLGGAVGQGIAAGLKQQGGTRRLSIATGAAAGLSATFSAPLAGTFFVLEGVYRNFQPTIWLSCLTGALCSNFVSENVFGLAPVLPITYQRLLQPVMYWQLLPLGLALGILGHFYNLGLLNFPAWYSKIKLIPSWLYCAIPLLLIIPIGMYFPATTGGGSKIIMLLATHHYAVLLILAWLALRFSFGLVSYGAGLPGGFFMPILTIGALIGAGYGTIMHQLGFLPANLMNNLIIFGMAGCLTAVCKAPFTSIILITELVGSTRNFMSLTIVVLIAYLTADLMGTQPIYQVLSERLTSIKRYIDSLEATDQLQVPVFGFSEVANQQVQDVKWPENTILITIKRGNLTILPHGSTVIKPGDTLIFLVHKDAVGYLYKELRQMATNQTDDLG